MTASAAARVALVTGAARGIGAATVGLLAGQGYDVLALDWCAGDAALDGIPYAMPTEDDLTRRGELPSRAGWCPASPMSATGLRSMPRSRRHWTAGADSTLRSPARP